MEDKERLPRAVVLGILAVALLLYSLGAWTVLAVWTGQEEDIPFVASGSGVPPSKPGTAAAPKTPQGGQASTPVPSQPPSPSPVSPSAAPVSPSPASTASGVATATGSPAPSLTIVTPPAAPSPSARQAAVGNLIVDVQDAETVTTLERIAPRRAGGVFVFLSLLVTNGERSRRLFGAGGSDTSGIPLEEQIGVALRDSAGNEYPAFGTEPPAETQKKWTPLPQLLDPLMQRQLTVAFDVPGDAVAFQLVLRAFPSRAEQRIQLEVPRAPISVGPTPPPPTATPTAVEIPTLAPTSTPTAALPAAGPTPTAAQPPGGPLLTGVGGATPEPKAPPALSVPLAPTPGR